MKTIKQNIIKYLLFILLGLFTNGCFSCPNPDYTEEIKEILYPVSKILEYFYTESQRFPSTSERNKMLENNGCLFGDKGDGYCEKDGVNFKVWNDSISNPPSDYTLHIRYKDVSCWVGLRSNGRKKYSLVSCDNHCPK